MPAQSSSRTSASRHQAAENKASKAGQVPAQRGSQPRSRSGGIAIPRPPVPRMPGISSGTARNVIWWGGLAAVAALGIVEWPVAAVVAAGTWVAGQQARGARPADQHADGA